MISAVVLTSCLGIRQSTSVSTRPMQADLIRLDLNMNDFQLLGDAIYDINYRRYFGCLTFIDSINGQPVKRRDIKVVQFQTQLIPDRKLARAISPIIDKYPDADFIVPVYVMKQNRFMFLGSKNKMKLKVKAYKFK